MEVDINGTKTTLYVQYTGWSSATTNGSSLSFDFDTRMYLSTQDTLDPLKYYKPNLLGGSFEFDVDMSQSGCGCVTTVFAVNMPGIDNAKDPFKYCDAGL